MAPPPAAAPPPPPDSPSVHSGASSTRRRKNKSKRKPKDKHITDLDKALAKSQSLQEKLGVGAAPQAEGADDSDDDNSLLNDQYTFHPLLLVDQREQSSNYIKGKVRECEERSGDNTLQILTIDVAPYSSQLLEAKVAAEVRTLPIGDMLWTVVVKDRFSKVVGEFLLGPVLERKTMVDLVSSVHGTRFNEQRLRMLAADVERRIYLVEGVGSTRDQAESDPTLSQTAPGEVREATKRCEYSGDSLRSSLSSLTLFVRRRGRPTLACTR